jgi:DNA-binding transcriptional regulator YhcF (GntR family)
MGRQAGPVKELEIAIDRDAEVPIGIQLAWALRARIDDGSFEPGRRLPGLRELAEATGVNANTVRAVYQRLDQEGLIETLQGSGTFVAATRRQPSDVATIAASAAQQAHETGVDLRDVAAALYMSPRPELQTKGEARRRTRLRDEIATLERAIGELEARHPGVAPGPHRARARGGPAMLGASDLEDVRTQLVRRLAAVQKAIDELLQVPDEAAAKADPNVQRSPRTAANPKRPRARRPTRPATAGA